MATAVDRAWLSVRSRTCCCASERWPKTTPQIAELDCNPVIVTTDGAVVVDARVRVEAVEPPRPLGARR
jgi:hypothetical protein